MKLTHDKVAQAGYIQFSDHAVAKTVPVSDTILCDLDQKGQLCGIEFLNLSKSELLHIKESISRSELSFC